MFRIIERALMRKRVRPGRRLLDAGSVIPEPGGRELLQNGAVGA
jgi:hypothetical protein